MTRCVTIFALAWMSLGCRAPAPSFDMLAPYGSPTVPPPRTGAVGTGGTYYAPAAPNAQPSATNPSNTTSPAVLPSVAAPSSAQPVAPPVSHMGGSTDALSDTATDVAHASYEPGSTSRANSLATTVTDDVLPPSPTPPVSDSSSALQLNGMRVNDATRLDEPKQFSPPSEPINIANLPSANSNAPAFLRFISPKSTTGGGTGTPTPATPPSGAWQAR